MKENPLSPALCKICDAGSEKRLETNHTLPFGPTHLAANMAVNPTFAPMS